MLRTFFPIGQGNFAAEQFHDGINIVFDCGSSSGFANVKRQIEDAFQPNEEIEKVFVSHLDDDHVNGLKHLLSYCRVREVYLPYLTEESRIYTKFFNFLESGKKLSSFVEELLSDPKDTVRKYGGENDTQVILVYPNGNEDMERSNQVYIPSGHLIRSPSQELREWFFIPYNFENRNRKDLFLKELKDDGYNINDLLDKSKGYNFWEKEYKRLKELYKKIPGKLNTNSMVVYSGLKDATMRRQRIYKRNYCHRCGCFYPDYPEGCLYTGDYDAAGAKKWKQLKDAYENVWKHIGTVQVPHHGSAYNYQPELSNMAANLVINAGYQNQYRHPHMSVLKDLIDNEASFYWVNEHVGSGVQFAIF